jgi:hypothetical protein
MCHEEGKLGYSIFISSPLTAHLLREKPNRLLRSNFCPSRPSAAACVKRAYTRFNRASSPTPAVNALGSYRLFFRDSGAHLFYYDYQF